MQAHRDHREGTERHQTKQTQTHTGCARKGTITRAVRSRQATTKRTHSCALCLARSASRRASGGSGGGGLGAAEGVDEGHQVAVLLHALPAKPARERYESAEDGWQSESCEEKGAHRTAAIGNSGHGRQTADKREQQQGKQPGKQSREERGRGKRKEKATHIFSARMPSALPPSRSATSARRRRSHSVCGSSRIAARSSFDSATHSGTDNWHRDMSHRHSSTEAQGHATEYSHERLASVHNGHPTPAQANTQKKNEAEAG